MKAVVRWLGSLAVASCLALVAAVSASPQPPPHTPVGPAIPIVSAALGSPANADALVSANTFVVMSDQTRQLAIGIAAPSPIVGSVTLSVTCCTDPMTGQTNAVAHLPTVEIAPAQLAIGPQHRGTATLTVKAFQVPTAAFLATVHVDSAAWKFHATGSILIHVVKVPVDDSTLCSGTATPGSAVAPEILPMNKAINSVFKGKQDAPSLTSFQVGTATKDAFHGWLMTIDSGGTMRPTASTVVFKNSTHLEKRIVPFDTSSCMPSLPNANFIVASGQSVTIPISSPQTTLVLQRIVCRFSFIGCWSWGYDDVGVFSAPPFWTLFGGRRVTIDWISGGADQ